MNIRNILKMQQIEFNIDKSRSHDNPYEYKIDIWHGPVEGPYHDAIRFTESELHEWLNNLTLLVKTLNTLMERQKNGQTTEKKDN